MAGYSPMLPVQYVKGIEDELPNTQYDQALSTGKKWLWTIFWL